MSLNILLLENEYWLQEVVRKQLTSFARNYLKLPQFLRNLADWDATRKSHSVIWST
ncbi:hypothetical protein Ocin01_15858 [Orchesella cincta]|uniref:Uncharacterized protein n=1 Tax=Orchesella cincta TaxID=48709 RepID=A0A1D2MD82_ORCCI|nr:hypothetical protein Ocin01_15858 [Orchesella cincta]